jgi:hypothetical protein
MAKKVRPLQQRDWDQLLIVATGYLPLTNGDLKAAMARAIVAHAGLIEAVKHGEISADLPRGRVSLFVPEGGGLALAFEPLRSAKATPSGSDAYADLGPPEITLEVHEGLSSYANTPDHDAGPHDDEDWSNQG